MDWNLEEAGKCAETWSLVKSWGRQQSQMDVLHKCPAFLNAIATYPTTALTLTMLAER
jgi:hypothetical protein